MPTPSAERPLPLREADLAACRTLLKTGSRSFFAAAHFLPYHCRDAATALYAFCRQADDAVDESGAPAEALGVLHERLDALYDGTPQNYPADRALAAVAQRRGLPKALLEALLEGFAWDAEGRCYEDLEGVLSYSARVAGAVGVMMAVLMGERDADVLARAADMGVAMQLTNISRDVGEDARNGRLYLPRAWLREAGIDPQAFLAAPAHSEGLAEVLARLLAIAATLYRRADSGLTRLPSRCRPGMYAARLLYSAIGEQLAERGYDAVSRRTVVPGLGKLQRLLSLGRMPWLSDADLAAPVLAENHFLVEAVNAHPGPRVSSLLESEGRISWVLERWAELDERARMPARAAISASGARRA
ncbi:phytoene/squalene synthase family protein [Pseudohaliea rubra]|uniref:Phytoene synthase n=1 Tax=Pseudohaliea rubra DSM 19751 TaxID=1265313 RepID=A0A095XZK4_9GAMM|nr:phytoene/squalene synthase family protein [Pseudohaliea rubra]KGE05196.1 Phytoene synthase [Pseudohaliea rubra DSM 19751]